LVQIHAGDQTGIGYTYADQATASLIDEKLKPNVIDRDPMDVTSIWIDLTRKVRNLGRPGVSSMAISAVDTALWDLKAKILGIPLVTLLGKVRNQIPVYGSGGFTSYTDHQLAAQLGGWADQGISRVKMKVGRQPDRDPHRVSVARDAIGSLTELFVDANGAYDIKQAIWLAREFADQGVSWFEEPVSSDNLSGLAFLRQKIEAPMDVTAGEYGYDRFYFLRMLEAQSVDVLQADITRCGGITGYLKVTHLCESFSIPLSTHCAPSLHLHMACASPPMRHMEYFFDHVEIERKLFDGFQEPVKGLMSPDLSRPGIGLEFKSQDAERFAA
jgi:L-alanine-DL-glutamate epimerase-like enolase superfamily enzyme